MTISVVVPTRDRPGPLAACLAALEAQTASDLEIIVIDDAEGRGPAAARNAGARKATGDVVCFTDDDCRPVPTWAATLAHRIRAGADAVAGPTVNGRPDDVWSAASQAMTNHLVDATRHGERVGFAPTSNLAVRAELLAAEPFDESYPLAAGEDREWCDRVARRGATFVFADDAVVHHHQDLSARRFVRQQLRYGRGARRYRVDGEKQPPGFYVDLLRAGFRHGPRAGAAVVLAQAVVAVGYARG
jgi:glycosyltransferase involved in cell wall biosynthesis